MTGHEIGRVAVIGLGQMGLPMALNLHRAGVEVLGLDPSDAAQAKARENGLALAADAAEAFGSSEIVILSLPHAGAVEAVVEAGISGLAGGGAPLVIDTSTSTAETSRALAQTLAAAGGIFVDAPVSGGPSGSREGTLTFMVGGAAEAVARCRPVLDILGKAVLHAGPTGAGNVAKLVNNLMVAGHMLMAREGLALAEAAGLEAGAALEVVNAASGGSTVSRVHVPTWILTGGFDSGFTMGLMRKDLRLAADLAAAHGLALPLGAEILDLWTAPEAPGDTEDFTRMGDYRTPARQGGAP